MATPLGFRKVKVIKDTAEAVLDNRGNYVYLEVTNSGASAIDFFVNEYPEQGSTMPVGIPIEAGTTRQIPMNVYKFRATGTVTVVAYGI